MFSAPLRFLRITDAHCFAQLGKLKLLVELQAFGNKLTSLPVALGQCSKLELLHLGNNQLAALPGDMLPTLTNLTELFIFKNAVRPHAPVFCPLNENRALIARLSAYGWVIRLTV